MAVAEQHPQVEHDGFTVTSNSGTVDDLRKELRIEDAPAAPEGDEAAIEESAKPQATEQPEQPEKIKGKDAKPRIDKLTYEREQAKREADEAKQEAARLRDELGRYKAKEPAPTEEPAKAQPKAEDDPEPQEGDFETYAQYVKAQARWEARQEFKEQQAKRDKEQRSFQRAQAVHQRREAFAARVSEAVKADPTLQDVLANADVQIHESGPMPDVITTSPVGVQMMRYLAEHPEEAAKLVAMPPSLALFGEMKKLEARIEARMEAAHGSAPSAKPATKAQPPIRPVVSSHVAVKDDGPPGDDASDDEHYAFWNNPENRRKYGVR